MLTSGDLVAVWEAGQQRHDADRALIVLSHAHPEADWDDLAELPLGQRDGLLMQVRQALFGSKLDIGVRCRRCSERLEFDSSIDELLPPLWAPTGPSRLRIQVADTEIEARPICTRDLARLSPNQPDAEVRRILIESSVLSARTPDGDISAAALPAPALDALAEALTEADPLADIEFQLDCPNCSDRWILIFDIVPFLWRELAQVAQSLLDEVYDLAVHLGWSQSEILSLSPARRAYYLARVRP
jgi:hypothetical protein